MKVCFFGLGSIGQRHIRNLNTVCERLGIDLEIHALRSSGRKLADDVSAQITRQESDTDSLDNDYDIGFITNPTVLHYTTLVRIADRCRDFFIEKPVFDRPDYDIGQIPLCDGAICYVAAPLRFCGAIDYMKQIAEKENIYSVRAICSSYLPDWRPGQDYRMSYSAKQAQGGGVRIDIIHELDYLTSIFGFPQKIYMLSGKYSHLEIDSEDLAAYIAGYPDKIIELHLDYFGRERTRTLEFYTETAVIRADINAGTIWSSDGKYQVNFNEDANEKYIREMAHFIGLRLEQGKTNINPISRAVDVLRLSEGILPG